MRRYCVDLHVHSRHSIGVSKRMDIPHIAAGATAKGLDIVGTGDATQPQWLDHLEHRLTKTGDGVLLYGDVAFILTVEVEDRDAVHHLVLLPDFEAVGTLRQLLAPHSPDIDSEWGGRPRVSLRGEELAGCVRDAGGMIGPAHAFTPFRSLFREGRYSSLRECYGDETQQIHFLELGLSADSETADHIPELRPLTYVSFSDAHSPTPDRLGREFVVFELEGPSFHEVARGLRRQAGRRPVLNVGLDPRLGKYYLSFCPSCRRTVVMDSTPHEKHYDDENIYFMTTSPDACAQLVRRIHRREVECPVDGAALRLGVRDRAVLIGCGESTAPPHRPPYLRTSPLLDVVAFAMGVKSRSAKSVRRVYDTLRTRFGAETEILVSTPVREIAEVDRKVAMMIQAYRDGSVRYVPGGGGRYGRLVPPWEVQRG